MRNQRSSAVAPRAGVQPPPVSVRPRRQAAIEAAEEPRPDGHLNLPMEAAAGLLAGPSHEAMIRRRAYERYERNGCVSGRELEDWLDAEAEVGAQLMVGRVGED